MTWVGPAKCILSRHSKQGFESKLQISGVSVNRYLDISVSVAGEPADVDDAGGEHLLRFGRGLHRPQRLRYYSRFDVRKIFGC